MTELREPSDQLDESDAVEPESPGSGGMRGWLVLLFLIGNALTWAIVLEPRVLQVPLILLGPNDWRISSIRALDGNSKEELSLLLAAYDDPDEDVAAAARVRLTESPSPLRFLPADSPELPKLRRQTLVGLGSTSYTERASAMKLARALGPLAGSELHGRAARQLVDITNGAFAMVTEHELRAVLAAGKSSGLDATLAAVEGARPETIRKLTTPYRDPFVAQQIEAFDRLIASDRPAHRMMAYQLVASMRPSPGGAAQDLAAGRAIPDARVEAIRAALAKDLVEGDADLRECGRFAADMLIAMKRLDPAESESWRRRAPRAGRPSSKTPQESPPEKPIIVTPSPQTPIAPNNASKSKDEERIR